MAHDHDRVAVIDGKLANVSATIIQGFRRCPRYWYYAEVSGLPKKARKPGADLGTQCHNRMETWLKTGEDVRGPIERHGHEMIEPFLKWAPFNGGPMLVEEKFKSLKTPGGVTVNGSFDALLPPGTARPTYATLLDHKFKKDLEKWATPSAELLVDEQFIVYGAYALSIYPEAEGVYFRHHNHQTNSRRNKPVECEDTRAGVIAKFQELGKFIDTDMARCAQAIDANAVPAKYGNACYAFGGCDFERTCPDSPRNRASANIFGLTDDTLTVKSEVPTQEVSTMGLMDQMMKAGSAPVVMNSDGGTLTVAKLEEPHPSPVSDLAHKGPEFAKWERAKKLEGSAYNALMEEPVTQTIAVSTPEGPKEANPKRAKAKKAEEVSGLTLLVDCFSAKAQDVTPWALGLAKQLAERHGVPDIRVAPKESDLSYGGWRAAMAQEAVKAPPSGVCYLAGSELTEPVIEALSAVATMVVRGRR